MTFSKVAEKHKELIQEIIDYAYLIDAVDAVGVKINHVDLEALALNVLIQCYQNGFYVTNDQGEHVINDVLQAVTIEALRSENGEFDRFTVKLETTKGPWNIDAWRVSYDDYGFWDSIGGIYSES